MTKGSTTLLVGSNRSLWLRGRLFAVALGGVLVAMAVSVVMAGTACACSCPGFAVDEAASRASAVFTARAIDKVSGGGDDIYEFAVSEVFKGAVGDITTVGTASQGASCGASYQVGREYLLFVSNGGVGVAWESNLCLGPTEQSDMRAALESVYGTAQPPDASAPDSRISRWSRTTAVIPAPLIALASVVTAGAVWWAAVAIGRRRRAGD